MKPEVGDLVVSLAGRDEGRMFFVLALEDGYALIADGRMRRADAPKRKKLKHLSIAAHPDCKVAEKLRAGEKVHSSELRKGLAEIAGQEE